MASEGINLYQIYEARKNEILSTAEEQGCIIKELHLDEIQQEGTKKGEMINGLISRLKSDTLKVLVIGKFSAGKSTFINALFGQSILPSSPTPTTGVLCEIKYADDSKKKAILHPKPGMGQNGSDSPFEIEISDINNELKKYVVIDNTGESDEISRFEKLELYYPLSLCKNNVEIIDSIGLDDPESRGEKETLQYMPSTDAIIYCMKSLDTYTGIDKKMLQLLRTCKYESIFFVITYFDSIRASVNLGEMKSEEEFKHIQYKNLSPWTELGEQGIMFVDSRAALLAKMNKDENLLEISNINKVEKALESFLVQEKGKAKLLNALFILKDANRSSRKAIQSRISMLEANIDELEERYENAQIPLRNLEVQHQLIIQKIDTKITDISRTANDMAYSYSVGLSSKIQNWASEYEIQSSVGFPPTKSKLEVIVSEVVNYLKDKIEEDLLLWTDSELSPMIETNFDEMQRSLEDQSSEFINSAESIRIQISIGDQIDNEAIAQGKKTTLKEKLIAGGYTLLTGDFITGGMGMVLGLKTMLNTLIIEIVSGAVLAFLGLLNPVTLVIALVASILGGNFLNMLSLKKGIKSTVAEKLIIEIDSNRNEICKNIENEVKKVLVKFRDEKDAYFAGEISSIRNEVEKVLEERTNGKFNIEEETRKLKILEQKNMSVEERLDKLLLEVGINDKSAI